MAEPARPQFLRPLAAPEAQAGFALSFGPEHPLVLDCGRELSPFTVAYMTYGTLNAARSNAVLVCHALTGDQFAASQHPVTGRPGWWENMEGPGKPVDTGRCFVICANVLGGRNGSTGPADMSSGSGAACWFQLPRADGGS